MSLGFAFLLAMGATQADPADETCGFYSQQAFVSGAFSGCWLKRAGELPLWQTEPDPGTVQVIRFVFSSGRDSSFRFITLVQQDDGKSWLVSGGLDSQYRKPRRWWPRRRKAMGQSDWEELDRLEGVAGTFDFEVGSWDGDDIYVHCQNLAMERLNRAGYRFSSVSISCNRPEKLAPLVDKIVEIADRDALFSGWVPN
jgi:hypothetical protein